MTYEYRIFLSATLNKGQDIKIISFYQPNDSLINSFINILMFDYDNANYLLNHQIIINKGDTPCQFSRGYTDALIKFSVPKSQHHPPIHGSNGPSLASFHKEKEKG